MAPHGRGRQLTATNANGGRRGGGAAKDTSQAFQIPYLPTDSPAVAAPGPEGLKLPLLPHQLRALYRMQLLERDGSLTGETGEGFNTFLEYRSRGGVLSDAVGLGKTCTAIALALSDDPGDDPAPTLVVAPSHLLPQWREEVRKFVGDVDGPGATLPVVQGAAAFEAWASAGGAGRRAIVLVDVKEVLAQANYWYDFRQLYAPVPRAERGDDGRLVQGYGRGQKLRAAPELIQQCRESASFVLGPKLGAITGRVYVGALHLGCTLRNGAGGAKRWPQRVWRRVIFDEVQDLVQAGSDAQDCFTQLTRKADNVWLLTATPFPHGNASVSANHQLLGFQRFNAGNVEVEGRLDPDHPFERIKRRLYIRSPASVRESAINAVVPVTRETVRVQLTPIERAFYDSAVSKAAAVAGVAVGAGGGGAEAGGGATAAAAARLRWFTSKEAQAVRMVCNHPAASDDLRAALAADSAARGPRGEAGGGGGVAGGTIEVPGMSSWDAVSNLSSMRQIAEKLMSHHSQRSAEVRRQRDYLQRSVGAIRNGLALAAHLNTLGDSMQSGWQLPVTREELLRLTADPAPRASRRFGPTAPEPLIRRQPPADLQQAFGTWADKEKEELLVGYEDVEEWAKYELLDVDKRREYIRAHERLLDNRRAKVNELERLLSVIAEDVTRFSATLEGIKEAARMDRERAAMGASGGQLVQGALDPDADLKLQHGSKPVALLRYLQKVLAHNKGDADEADFAAAAAAAAGAGAAGAPACTRRERHKVIVFSMWHGVLKMVQKTLRRNDVRSVWCEGTAEQKQRSLAVFNQPSDASDPLGGGGCDVLLMSAQSAAAGANLQAASHVVLMDPAGASAVHGATLERQAVGRAVRMGQTKTVTVTRMIVEDTIEGALYADVDEAAAQLELKEGTGLGAVAVEGAHNPLPAPAEPEVRAVRERTWEEIEAEKRREAERAGQMVDLASEDGLARAAAAAAAAASDRLPIRNSFDTTAAAAVSVKMEGVPRVKLEGGPSAAAGFCGKKRGVGVRDGGENTAPSNVEAGADGGGDGGVLIVEEVAPAEAERRKLARLVAVNKYEFVDLT